MTDLLGALKAALQDAALMETLAAIEHERWSDWQQHLHEQCVPGPDGSLTIPADKVRRWSRQLSTPYSELSEAEREKDREQVRRYLPVIPLSEAVLSWDSGHQLIDGADWDLTQEALNGRNAVRAVCVRPGNGHYRGEQTMIQFPCSLGQQRSQEAQ